MGDKHSCNLLTDAANKLADAGATRVLVEEHRERLTGGSWLTANVLWRHEYHRLDTSSLSYESWTQNVVAMTSRLHVLAAQLQTKD